MDKNRQIVSKLQSSPNIMMRKEVKNMISSIIRSNAFSANYH